jgi:hypothetical protein
MGIALIANNEINKQINTTMNYQEIVKQAEKAGKFDTKRMWLSIANVSDMLEELKDEHEDMYWKFLRKQVGIMTDCHYNKEFAEWDVSQMAWTDKDGVKHRGAYWTQDQTKEATSSVLKEFFKGASLPSGVTDWDVYVALNGYHADLCGVISDDTTIIKAAIAFYFFDEDWDDGDGKTSPTKTWEYFYCKNE